MSSTNDEWKKYPRNRRCRVTDKGLLIIVPEDHTDRVPLWCPVCKTVFRTNEDEESYIELKCCYACALDWAHARRAEWLNGWRPNPEHVEERLTTRTPIVTVI